MDPGARPRDRPPAGSPGLGDAAGGRRRRHPGHALLQRLLLPRGARPRPVRRRPHGVRRLDGGPRGRRRPAPAVRVLGAHHRVLLPADRPLRGPHVVAPGRHAGADRDHCRRPGDAGRRCDPRGRCRDLERLRGDRRPAVGPSGHRRRGLPARRGGHQVRARAHALLAARRDGRPHTRLGIPPRRRDGEGRDLPDRTVRARLLGPRGLADRGARARRRHAPARRIPGAAAARPQARPRVRHGLAARPAHAPARLRDPGDGARRAGPAGRPRPVQGLAVPGGRAGRRGDRHARPAQARRDRTPPAGHRARRDARHRVDDRAATVRRLRRQGGGAHRVGARRGRARQDHDRGGRRGLGPDGGLRAPVPVGSLQAAPAGRGRAGRGQAGRGLARRRRTGQGPRRRPPPAVLDGRTAAGPRAPRPRGGPRAASRPGPARPVREHLSRRRPRTPHALGGLHPGPRGHRCGAPGGRMDVLAARAGRAAAGGAVVPGRRRRRLPAPHAHAGPVRERRHRGHPAWFPAVLPRRHPPGARGRPGDRARHGPGGRGRGRTAARGAPPPPGATTCSISGRSR